MTKSEELDEHRKELDKSYDDCIDNRASVLDVVIDLKYAYDALAEYVLERDAPPEALEVETRTFGGPALCVHCGKVGKHELVHLCGECKRKARKEEAE